MDLEWQVLCCFLVFVPGNVYSELVLPGVQCMCTYQCSQSLLYPSFAGLYSSASWGRSVVQKMLCLISDSVIFGTCYDPGTILLHYLEIPLLTVVFFVVVFL